ncbi:MAG: precorrin-3B C(17)-methyltransferase [Nitrospirota bacterium]
MAIECADVIIGYETYLNIITPLLEGKEVISSGMMQEIERCSQAIEMASEGRVVALVSGGDPGIYGMAGLVFEILSAEEGKSISSEEKDKNFRPQTSELQNFRTSELFVEVIPGIAALNAAASRLGAPLMHDFASISLSDLLTPWDVIVKRLEASAASNFVIVLYNPKSKKRTEQIKIAHEIISKYRNPETPVGIVRHATKPEEEIVITTLGQMLKHKIDMQSIIIIGNSQTFIWKNWMVTPRGYGNKFKIAG